MLYALICSQLLLTSWTATPQSPPPHIVTVADVAYYGEQAPDDYARSRCKLDVTFPKDGHGYATLVWFHGGGLKEGDRRAGDDLAKRLNQSGIAVVLVDYRLSPRAKCPAYIEDAAASVAWALKHIASYGGDPRRVFVGGHSAGAYLTAMVGVDATYLGRHGLAPKQLAGLIPVSGQMFTHFTIREERQIPATTPLIDALAPAHHAAKETPPTLCMVGDQDLPTRLEENVYCAAAYKAAGNERFRCQIFAGRDHNTLMTHVLEPDDEVARAMLAFMEEAAPTK
jgi:acetyl esterase/lipase